MKITAFQWSALNFFGFFCGYGVLLPFLPMWLKANGFEEQIGLIIALGYLFRFAGGMLFSQRIKYTSQLIPLTRTLSWLSVAVIVGVAFSTASIWLLLPAIGLFHLVNGGAMPINDTIAATWQQQIKMDYGRARLFGSLAFVIGSISGGYLVGWLGEQSIIWILFVFLLLLASGQMLTPKHHFEQVAHQNTQQSLSFWQIFKQPTTCRMLIAISLIQASHAAYYTYSTVYWAEHHISTQTSSLLWGLSVMAEIVLFFFATKAFKAWKISHLVVLSCLAALLRWVLLASTVSLPLLIFSQLLHALTFGVGHYAMIRYISTQPTEQMAKLQALYFGFASCGFIALFTLLADVVYQQSASMSFWLMALLVLPAMWIVPKKRVAKTSNLSRGEIK